MGAKFLTSALFMLSALLPSMTIRADTTLEIEGSPDAINTAIQVKGNMVRMTLPGRSDYILYDRARNTGILVNQANREYREINQDLLERYAGMVATMRENLRTRLHAMAPAQRARLEEQMESLIRIPAADMLPDLEGIRLQARGRKTVAGFNCQAHLLLRGRQPVAEVCMTTTASAGIPARDFATMMSMMDFIRNVSSSAQQLTGNTGNRTRILMDDLQGIPVAVKDFQNRRIFLVRGVSGKPLDSRLFTAYQVYKKQDLLTSLAMGH